MGTLLSVSDGRRNFEETSKKCPKYFECVHRSVCEQYNQRYAEYERTNNVEIITELKALICNKRKRAVCCRQEQFASSESSCGKPQKIPKSIINGTKTAPGEFPFSGLIGYQKKDVYKGTLPNGRIIFQDVNIWICSGVIISPRFLVTAAHCKKKDQSQFMVALGLLHLSTNLKYGDNLPEVQIFKVNEEDFVVHRDYAR